MFDIGANFFFVFSLPVAFAVDLVSLKQAHLALQKELHPDNFATSSDAEQLKALQSSSYLNQAYSTLKDPIKRAAYLLKLQDNNYQPDTQINQETAYIFDQIRLREQLEDVGDLLNDVKAQRELNLLREETAQSFASYQIEFESLFAKKDLSAAALIVDKMMFAEKFLSEIEEQEEALYQ